MELAETTFWRTDSVATLAAPVPEPRRGESEVDRIWTQLATILQEFKSAAGQVAKELTTKTGITEESAQRAREVFEDCMGQVGQAIAEEANVSDETREIIGERLFEEFLPYLSLTETAQRFFTKPRGYAGDFYTIEMIYNNEVGGHNDFGVLVDNLFRNMPPAKAVRNRRELLADEIHECVRTNSGANVMSIACGPARELIDVYEQLDDPSLLKSTLVDLDEQAIDYVGDQVAGSAYEKHMAFHQQNIVYLATGRRQIDIEPQDLIYSIGLIDYFTDRHVVRLMDYAYDQLKPGGKVILGNFHTTNLHKPSMDYILDWKLIHRNEEDMNRLFRQSKFNKPCTEIKFEAEGINMFATCTK